MPKTVVSKKIGWASPVNEGGQRKGLNDSGIEQFRSDALKHTTKESTQNSKDAPNQNKEKPVEVHFSLHHLPMAKFPEKDEFVDILGKCKDFPKWRNIAETQDFFENANETMNKATMPVLKISDYNTTGLVGSKNEPDTDSDQDTWNSLVKSSGVSDKPQGSGGSFGIGKNAPFVSSSIRTVFYCTRDYENTIAFQGVSNLVTYINHEGKLADSTCYFGLNEGKKPIFDFSDIDEFFYKKR